MGSGWLDFSPNPNPTQNVKNLESNNVLRQNRPENRNLLEKLALETLLAGSEHLVANFDALPAKTP